MVYNDPNGYVYSYEDDGTAFLRRTVSIGKPSASNWKGGTQYAPGYIAVSPDEKIMLAGCRNWSRVDLATGVLTASKVTGTEVVFGPDGRVAETVTVRADGFPWVRRAADLPQLGQRDLLPEVDEQRLR